MKNWQGREFIQHSRLRCRCQRLEGVAMEWCVPRVQLLDITKTTITMGFCGIGSSVAQCFFGSAATEFCATGAVGAPGPACHSGNIADGCLTGHTP